MFFLEYFLLYILYWHAFWDMDCCVYCINSYLNVGYFCPSLLYYYVMTTSLLWIGLVQTCILYWFCLGGSLVVCIVVFVTAWLCPFWIMLPVACDLWLCVPLWQSSNGKIFLEHEVTIKLLSVLLYFLSVLKTGFCW